MPSKYIGNCNSPKAIKNDMYNLPINKTSLYIENLTLKELSLDAIGTFTVQHITHSNYMLVHGAYNELACRLLKDRITFNFSSLH